MCTSRTIKEPPLWQRAIIPSISDVLFVALFLLLVSIGSSVLLSDADIGWHIKTGEYILQTGAVPREDIFSYTLPGRSWYAWEWLSDVILAALHRAMGLNGVVVGAALLIALTYTLLFRFLLQRSRDLLLSLFLALVAFLASSIHWLARPHLASWLLTLVCYRLIDADQISGKRYGWALPFLMVLWVNLHGGFLLGLLLLAVYSVGNLLTYWTAADRSRRAQAARRAAHFTVLLGVCAVATLINPYGYKLHEHILDYLRSPITYEIPGEFRSPDFHIFPIKFFEWLLLLALPLSLLPLRTLNFIPGLLAVAFIHISLIAVRNVPLAGLILASTLATELRRVPPALAEQTALRGWLRAAVQRLGRFSYGLARTERQMVGHWLPAVLSLTVFFIGWNGGRIFGKDRLSSAFVSYKYPMAVSQFIRSHPPPGRMFNTYEWGGLLIYNLYPEVKVFIDSRTDFYPEDFIRRYLAVVEVKPDWKKILDEAGIDWIVVSAQSALAAALKETPAWKAIYDDKVAILFVRSGGYPSLRGTGP